MTGPIVVPLADDLLATPRMTIKDLIESSEVFITFSYTASFNHVRSILYHTHYI